MNGSIDLTFRMKMYVHIGTHKTGTKSIQAFLRKNACMLRANGIYVPVSGTVREWSGHHNIAWELRSDPRFRRAMGTVRDMVDELKLVQPSACIVTSEDFEYLVDRPELIGRFERAVYEVSDEIEYIQFWRQPAEYAVSLYAELQKRQLGGSFREFVDQILKNRKFVTKSDWVFYFDPWEFAEKWKRKSTAILTMYDFDCCVRTGKLVPEFLSAIGAPERIVKDGVDTGIRNRRRSINVPWREIRYAEAQLSEKFGWSEKVRERFL